MKTTIVLPIAFATLITACAPAQQLSANRIPLSPDLERQARAIASSDLVDPGSAQYRGLRAFQLSNGDIAVCGEQNGRNRFGGFVGFKPLYVRFTPGASPTPRSIKREFLAQTACGGLDGGRGVPVASG